MTNRWGKGYLRVLSEGDGEMKGRFGSDDDLSR